MSRARAGTGLTSMIPSLPAYCRATAAWGLDRGCMCVPAPLPIPDGSVAR